MVQKSNLSNVNHVQTISFIYLLCVRLAERRILLFRKAGLALYGFEKLASHGDALRHAL